MKLALFTFLLMSSFLHGQVSNDDRLELEMKDGFVREEVHEFGSKGFVLFARSQTAVEGSYSWKFDSYSTDLEIAETVTIEIDTKFKLDETFRDKDNLHLLFKGRKGAYLILNIDAVTLKKTETKGEFGSRTTVKGMTVLNNFAFLTTYTKGVSQILSINLENADQRFFPIEIEGFKSKKIVVESMQVSRESNEIFVFVEAVKSKKESTTFILRMDDNGKLKGTYDFSQAGEEIITSATASYISEGKYVLTGTYSKKNRHTSEGMFFSTIQDGEIQNISFYNFLDLDNFLNYLPERKQKKIEKKKKRKNDKGKEWSVRYFLASHNIIEVDDGYIFLAEAYYPTYRQESYTTTSFTNGIASTTTHYRTVFDGYQYTHALIAKFDTSGNKEWDQCFKMYPAYKPFYVKRFINITEQKQDAVKLVYASGSSIYSKEIGFDGEITQEEESEEISTGNETDKMKRSFSNISFWYDKYFIAYGFQTIKDEDKEKKKGIGKRKRKVFFVNKVAF